MTNYQIFYIYHMTCMSSLYNHKWYNAFYVLIGTIHERYSKEKYKKSTYLTTTTSIIRSIPKHDCPMDLSIIT